MATRPDSGEGGGGGAKRSRKHAVGGLYGALWLEWCRVVSGCATSILQELLEHGWDGKIFLVLRFCENGRCRETGKRVLVWEGWEIEIWRVEGGCTAREGRGDVCRHVIGQV